MTTGQLVFYSGVGLLALTILLAVVFAVKKPRYDPETAGLGPGSGSTRKLRSGYPTDPLTIRRASPRKARPSPVMRTMRVVRWKSVTPSSFSREWICWVTAGWVTCSCSAARAKLSVSATARKQDS